MSELGLGRTLVTPATRTPSPAADASYLRQLLERQPGCLVRVQRDGVFLACNDAALGLFGVDTLGAILNTNLTDRLAATDRGAWQEFANRVWTGGAASFECHLAIPDGAERTVLIQGIAIKDHPDGVNSLLLSLRDTSLTHRLETSLQTEEINREGHDGREKETREQLDQALADRRQLAAQIEEHQAERQRLTAALDTHIADRQRREAEYRQKSAELERRAEENQLAFLIRERETSDRIARLEVELAASAAAQARLASAHEQQLAGASQQDLTSHEPNGQALADLELRLQAATAEQARLLALAAEHEAQRQQLDAEHRAIVENREQALSRAREERALGIAQAHRELSELGLRLTHALGEQDRLSGLIEERERERDRIDAEHRRALADLEASNGEALAECERVLTEEHEQVRQQNERQRFELADLKKRHAEAVAERQRLSDLVKERERQQTIVDADHARTIGEIEARHEEALAAREQAWHAEREQIRRQRDDQEREMAGLKEGQAKAVAEQRRLSELLKQTEAERQQLQAERAADGVELDRRLSGALDQAMGSRESANRERIANLQLELAQAVSDQMRLQAAAAQGEGRLKRLVAEYGVDRAQAERALGEAIFKKNKVLKALADQRVELQRWQDAATELEPLAAAGRLAADVAGDLQEVLSHVDAQAKFVLTLCSSDAVSRAEIEALRSDALRAASLARQFALLKVRQLEVPLLAEPERVEVSVRTPAESLED